MIQKQEETSIERALLAGLSSPRLEEDSSDEASMEELRALLETAGGECAGIVIQNREAPEPRSFVGAGKLREIREFAENQNVSLIVFDNELTPSQLRVLAEETGVRVIDRSALILDIFAQRAQTREGRLQVQLAQYRYLLPRLAGLGKSLSRLGGGIGTRGPGESKLESDRRHIRRLISKLEEDLEDVRKNRSVQRQRRLKNQVPVAAIVGYTNAGKSTLLNALTGAGIPANNRLFDTLDTTTRSLKISDTLEVLASDTVGFIRKLPHHLISAFKATLEELCYADLLIHVIDASNPRWREQAAVVEELIAELGAAGTPRLDVFNKAELLNGDILPRGENVVRISALEGKGIGELKAAVERILDAGSRRATFRLPYSRAGLLEQLHREAKINREEYAEGYIQVEAVCPAKTLGQLREFVVFPTEPQ